MIGKIFFAYVDDLEVFDPDVHNREDEDIFNLEISQNEGEFTTAKFEMKNPRQGLLNPARKKRIFISCDQDGDVILLFSGRIQAFPISFASETIDVDAIGQPVDWYATQNSFVQSLKVAPYYNQLFLDLDRRDEHAEILSTYPAFLHWNRITGSLSLSDILEGQTLLDIGPNFIFDSLETEVGDPPVNSIIASIEVQWNQVGLGLVDCGEPIRQAFVNSAIGIPKINTLTPLALESGWKGARTPSGYSVVESFLNPIADGDGLTQPDLRSGLATVSGVDYPTKTGATPPSRQVSIPRVWYEGRLKLQAEYQQKRQEFAFMEVNVETQNISLTSDQQEILSLRLQDPTLTDNGSILDVGNPSFFYDIPGGVLTSYGEDAIEYIILRCQARLKKAARVIEVQFDCPLEDVIDLTCDHSIRITDDRLPAGSLRGKVIGYTFTISGDSGATNARIKIGSCVGTGNDSVGTGNPVGFSEYENEFGSSPMDSQTFYEIDGTPVIDVPVDVNQMETDQEYLVQGVTVLNDGENQNIGWVGSATPDVYLQANRTSVEVELKSMNPDSVLTGQIDILCSLMTLPKHIDLEAA